MNNLNVQIENIEDKILNNISHKNDRPLEETIDMCDGQLERPNVYASTILLLQCLILSGTFF